MKWRASKLPVRTLLSTCKARGQLDSQETKEKAHLVEPGILLERRSTRRVQIASHDGAALLACWDGERPDTGESITDDVVLGERVDELAVLALESRVPVDGREVEGEGAVGLGLWVRVGERRF